MACLSSSSIPLRRSANYDRHKKELIKDEKSIEKIKKFLDDVKSLQEFVKLVIPKDRTVEKDAKFYSELTPYYEKIKEIIPLYNKVRNYVTQKPYSTEKIKLNFECPTLLNGWDANKEEANLGVILLKEGKYYLGIINPYCKKIFEVDEKDSNEQNNYKKMEYKLLPGPNKMLPKVFFSNSRIEEFNPSVTTTPVISLLVGFLLRPSLQIALVSPIPSTVLIKKQRVVNRIGTSSNLKFLISTKLGYIITSFIEFTFNKEKSIIPFTHKQNK